MSRADDIRRFVYSHYLEPAFAGGATEASVRSGDVHHDMQFDNRMPDICSALEAKKFQVEYGLRLAGRTGPARSSTVVFVFQRSDDAVRPEGPFSPRKMMKPVSGKGALLRPVRVLPDADTVFLVSCVAGKRARRAAARDLYTSDWFVKARHYVEATGRPWYILSAEHGLVHPDTPLEPYETTLNTMPVAQRRAWAERVDAQLAEAVPTLAYATFLAGQRYREILETLLNARGVETAVPMAGLRIGEQLAWLAEQTHDDGR